MFEYIDLLGVPFVQDGRSKDGFDCYGLTQEMFRRYGKEIGEYYCSIDDKAKINELFRNATKKWKEIKYKKGEFIPVPALIGFCFNAPSGVVNHTGVYIGDGNFIHTRDKVGVCVENINSPMWKRKIVGIYEYVGD